MQPAESRVVEIRVAGTVGPIVSNHLPGFVAAAEGPFTVISGRLVPGGDLTTVLAVLIRHGVRALDSRVCPSPGAARAAGGR